MMGGQKKMDDGDGDENSNFCCEYLKRIAKNSSNGDEIACK